MNTPIEPPNTVKNKGLRKYWNRIKTLYWFWKITRRYVDGNRWIIEVGKYPPYWPKGQMWMEVYSPDSWFKVNRDK